MVNRERAVDYLNTREHLFVVDGFAGWDERYRFKVRIICSRAYHALFMWNMLIRPTPTELEHFGDPDYVIYNAGAFTANRYTSGMTSKTSVSLNFARQEFVILGTEYAGEMKKGVFTIMNYLMPLKGRALDALLGERRGRTARRLRSSSASRAPARPPSPPIPTAASSATTSTSGATRRLQHRGRLLRQGDQPDRGGRARDLQRDPLRLRARERRLRQEHARGRLHRHLDHREHALQLSGGVHPQREDPLRVGAPEQRHHPHLRRVRRPAAGRQAHPRAGDVPLHQRLHGEGRGHRDGREGAVANVLGVLRSRLHGVAPEQVRRAPRRAPQAPRRVGVAREHRLDRRRLRRRQGVGKRMSLKLHPRHHRRDRAQARQLSKGPEARFYGREGKAGGPTSDRPLDAGTPRRPTWRTRRRGPPVATGRKQVAGGGAGGGHPKGAESLLSKLRDS